jgi:hypothetical protein
MDFVAGTKIHTATGNRTSIQITKFNGKRDYPTIL